MRRSTLLPFSPPLIGQEEVDEVVDTLRSGWITTGPKTQKFEQEFARYVGCRYAVAVNSCTAGLFLSLLVAGVKEGDEVITSPYTYVSTANVILHLGARPVFVDVEKETFNIDPKKIALKITKKTKAIVPVHFAGRPCEMETINRIAEKNGLMVIEDAAHAISAKYKSKKVGAISDFTCFSFSAVKNLTTAEGGMVTTDDKKRADRIRLLSVDGIEKNVSKTNSWFYQMVVPGYRFNLTDIASSIGLWQLKKLERNYRKRLNLYKLYNAALSKIPAISVPSYKINGRHALHLYPILIKDNFLKIDRNQFIRALAAQNISANVHFIPVHLHPYYKKTFGFKRGDYPHAEYLFDHEVTLPLYLSLTENDIKDVTTAIKNIIKGYSK